LFAGNAEVRILASRVSRTKRVTTKMLSKSFDKMIERLTNNAPYRPDVNRNGVVGSP
jgi:hypothetical protein